LSQLGDSLAKEFTPPRISGLPMAKGVKMEVCRANEHYKERVGRDA